MRSHFYINERLVQKRKCWTSSSLPRDVNVFWNSSVLPLRSDSPKTLKHYDGFRISLITFLIKTMDRHKFSFGWICLSRSSWFFHRLNSFRISSTLYSWMLEEVSFKWVIKIASPAVINMCSSGNSFCWIFEFFNELLKIFSGSLGSMPHCTKNEVLHQGFLQ